MTGMRILVAGGTGFIGSRLAPLLVDRGHEVVVLARNPNAEPMSADVVLVQGNVTDPETLDEAFQGIDGIVNLVALSPLFVPEGGERMHDWIHRAGTGNLVRAAERHGVSRIIQVSAINADPDAPTAHLRAKGHAEAIVRETDIEGTILRPSVVFGDGGEFVPFTRQVAPPYVSPLPGGGRTRFQPIWVEDFVPLVADALEDDAHTGSTYEIGGPEVLTLAAIAKLMHAAAGRRTTVVPVPMPLARLGMTIGDAIPGFPFGRDQYRSLEMDLVVETNDVRAFGIDPADLTPLSAYLEPSTNR